MNSIHARSLQRRLFHVQVEDTKAEHKELLLHTNARWLSRGKFLARFSELLTEVTDFSRHSKDALCAQLDDEQWLMDEAFLTDLTGTLNELNLELQGKNKTIINMISSVNASKHKLQIHSTKLQCQDLCYFESMH